jgi:hypothetical protein
MNVPITNPWFPYGRVQDSYFDLRGSELIPRKICDYLIDAPVGDYTPPDNNDYARCRLWKYLFYDGSRPLENALPTISQKMSVVFDPESPENPPTEKGYRLIPQVFLKQSQTDAQTRIFVYMGRTVPSNNELTMSLSVKFAIYTHYTYELNTKSDVYSRVFAIEQAIIEALHGVNMDGVGTFFMGKTKHPDCGSRELYDGNTNLGRELTMAIEIATVADSGFTETDNMMSFGGGGHAW